MIAALEIPTEYNKAEYSPYKPQGAALDLFYCQDEEILIEGPAGTGKTRAILEKMVFIAKKYPKSRILLVRKTRESMTESVIVTLEEKVLPENHPAKYGPRRSHRQSYSLWGNGSEIILGGLDKISKIMSTEYDIICIFEATEATENELETLTSRLRNHQIPYQQIICDCNPGPPTHWLNKRAASGKMTRLLSRFRDNPTVDDAYLSKLQRLSGVRRKRLYEGVWAAAEGMVYEGWNPDTHLIKKMKIPDDWGKFMTIDFGYTNPFVCQWWAVDNDGRAYLYKEIYHTRRLVEDHAEHINAINKLRPVKTAISDHDAEDRATLHKRGIITIPAQKAVSTGIECVQNRLRVQEDGKPRIFIFHDATVEIDQSLVEMGKPTGTAQEFDSYCYPENKEGKPVKEEPVKVDDHGMDAMRYGMMWLDRHLYGKRVPGIFIAGAA